MTPKTNLLANPSFEVDLSSWNSAGTSTAEQVATHGTDGTHAAHVIFDGSTDGPFFYARSQVGLHPTTGGIPMVVSVDLAGTGSLYLVAHIWVNGYAGHRVNSIPITLTAQTTRYQVSATSLGGDTVDEWDLMIGSDYPNGGVNSAEVFIDRAQLEQGTRASSFENPNPFIFPLAASRRR